MITKEKQWKIHFGRKLTKKHRNLSEKSLRNFSNFQIKNQIKFC